nr:MAG TPA: hypothetical protein [Caudoviricetes sp.]
MGWSLTAPTLPSGSSWVQKDTIKISNNQLVDNSTDSSTFPAPALLGPTVYIKVAGTWKQASAIYVKSSGTWKEGQLKIKVGGAWK